jgi:hypothetical protein
MGIKRIKSKLNEMTQPLTPDGNFLFITRIARMFGYGFLSVVLVLYLTQIGLSETQIGLLLTLTLRVGRVRAIRGLRHHLRR